MDKSIGRTPLAEHTNKFWGIYRGIVRDNLDPLQLGRVKVQVYPMLGGITDYTTLPWSIPCYPLWVGSGSGTGYFAVPDIGTRVYVQFEEGDIYQPICIGEAPDGVKGLPTNRTTNYPNRRISRTANGIEIMVDDTAKQVKVSHPTGTYILIDTNGKITVHGVHDVDVTAINVNITGSTSVNINPV